MLIIDIQILSKIHGQVKIIFEKKSFIAYTEEFCHQSRWHLLKIGRYQVLRDLTPISVTTL